MSELEFFGRMDGDDSDFEDNNKGRMGEEIPGDADATSEVVPELEKR